MDCVNFYWKLLNCSHNRPTSDLVVHKHFNGIALDLRRFNQSLDSPKSFLRCNNILLDRTKNELHHHTVYGKLWKKDKQKVWSWPYLDKDRIYIWHGNSCTFLWCNDLCELVVQWVSHNVGLYWFTSSSGGSGDFIPEGTGCTDSIRWFLIHYLLSIRVIFWGIQTLCVCFCLWGEKRKHFACVKHGKHCCGTYSRCVALLEKWNLSIEAENCNFHICDMTWMHSLDWNAHCLPGKSAFIWTGVGGKKVLTRYFCFGVHMSESTSSHKHQHSVIIESLSSYKVTLNKFYF